MDNEKIIKEIRETGIKLNVSMSDIPEGCTLAPLSKLTGDPKDTQFLLMMPEGATQEEYEKIKGKLLDITIDNEMSKIKFTDNVEFEAISEELLDFVDQTPIIKATTFTNAIEHELRKMSREELVIFIEKMKNDEYDLNLNLNDPASCEFKNTHIKLAKDILAESDDPNNTSSL